jgi:integrase
VDAACRLLHGITAFVAGAVSEPQVVQATLGHSQISLTMDTYSHVSTTMQAEAASLMDDAVRKRA